VIELAMELTSRGAILPDGKALMTVEQARALIIERMKVVELAVTERVSAAISRHDQLNYDLKEYNRIMGIWERAFSGFSTRLMAIEKQLGIDPFRAELEHPGKGHWKLTARTNRKPRTRTPRLTGPEPSWRKQAEADAKRLRAELPPTSSLPDLMRLFGVSRGRLDTLIGRGKLKTMREGWHIGVTRESIVEYVRENGTPKPRVRHYGTAVST
jgi:hypothetical protein